MSCLLSIIHSDPTPSIPTVSVRIQAISIIFSWNQSREDKVTNYTLNLSYKGECLNQTSMNTEVVLNGAGTSQYAFTSLEEFSNYSFTIIASNPAGKSPAETLIVTTLPTVPSGPVKNLVISSSTSTSITIEWDMVECIDRNGEITGYTVKYGLVTEVVSGTNQREFSAVGLIPSSHYTFQVTPNSNQGNGVLSESVQGMTSSSEGELYS